jgi:hypothetical protein
MNIKRTALLEVLLGTLLVVGLYLAGLVIDAKLKKISKPKAQVELLFVNDGCKVYRFMDLRETVYYVDCRTNGSTQTSVEYEHGRVSVGAVSK